MLCTSFYILCLEINSNHTLTYMKAFVFVIYCVIPYYRRYMQMCIHNFSKITCQTYQSSLIHLRLVDSQNIHHTTGPYPVWLDMYSPSHHLYHYNEQLHHTTVSFSHMLSHPDMQLYQMDILLQQ